MNADFPIFLHFFYIKPPQFEFIEMILKFGLDRCQKWTMLCLNNTKLTLLLLIPVAQKFF